MRNFNHKIQPGARSVWFAWCGHEASVFLGQTSWLAKQPVDLARIYSRQDDDTATCWRLTVRRSQLGLFESSCVWSRSGWSFVVVAWSLRFSSKPSSWKQVYISQPANHCWLSRNNQISQSIESEQINSSRLAKDIYWSSGRGGSGGEMSSIVVKMVLKANISVYLYENERETVM